MRPIDIILLAAIAAAVFLALFVLRRARKAGKGCCAAGGRGCEGCTEKLMQSSCELCKIKEEDRGSRGA